jgi:hypothetical protein
MCSGWALKSSAIESDPVGEYPKKRFAQPFALSSRKIINDYPLRRQSYKHAYYTVAGTGGIIDT